MVAPATAISTLVTSAGAPAAELERLRDAGVEIVIAMTATAGRPAVGPPQQRGGSKLAGQAAPTAAWPAQ